MSSVGDKIFTELKSFKECQDDAPLEEVGTKLDYINNKPTERVVNIKLCCDSQLFTDDSNSMHDPYCVLQSICQDIAKDLDVENVANDDKSVTNSNGSLASKFTTDHMNCSLPPCDGSVGSDQLSQFSEENTDDLDRILDMLQTNDDTIKRKNHNDEQVKPQERIGDPCMSKKNKKHSNIYSLEGRLCNVPTLATCERLPPIQLSTSDAILIQQKSICMATRNYWYSSDSCETVNSLNSGRSCASLPPTLRTNTPSRSSKKTKRPWSGDFSRSPDLSCFRSRAVSPDSDSDCDKFKRGSSVPSWTQSKFLQRIFNHQGNGSTERRTFDEELDFKSQRDHDDSSSRGKTDEEVVVNVNRYRSLSQKRRLPYYTYYYDHCQTPPLAMFMSNEDISSGSFPLRHVVSEPSTNLASFGEEWIREEPG